MLWKDPDRWVDSDMQRDAWLRLGVLSIIVTVLVIVIVILILGITGIRK